MGCPAGSAAGVTRRCSSDDFPLPDGPMIATTRPGSRCKVGCSRSISCSISSRRPKKAAASSASNDLSPGYTSRLIGKENESAGSRPAAFKPRHQPRVGSIAFQQVDRLLSSQ